MAGQESERPLYAVTGGSNPCMYYGDSMMDGYLDTTDALSSHREREKKLEILKDSHVGAFAVIWTGLYPGQLWPFTELREKQEIMMVAIGFVTLQGNQRIGCNQLPKRIGQEFFSLFCKRRETEKL